MAESPQGSAAWLQDEAEEWAAVGGWTDLDDEDHLYMMDQIAAVIRVHKPLREQVREAGRQLGGSWVELQSSGCTSP